MKMTVKCLYFLNKLFQYFCSILPNIISKNTWNCVQIQPAWWYYGFIQLVTKNVSLKALGSLQFSSILFYRATFWADLILTFLCICIDSTDDLLSYTTSLHWCLQVGNGSIVNELYYIVFVPFDYISTLSQNYVPTIFQIA